MARFFRLYRFVFALGAAATPWAGHAAPGPAGERGGQNTGDLVISADDGPRTAIVRPVGTGPQPTVIVLHGATMTARGTIRVSGFAEAAAGNGFTAVFPQGLRRQWNDGRFGRAHGPDDVAFLRALVDRLIRDHIARPGHLYLAGISNGGMMTFTMACKAGPLFRGIGTVIAAMPTRLANCALPALPLVMVNGTADPIVPYGGGDVGLKRRGRRGTVLSAMQTADLFARRDGCKDSVERPVGERHAGATVSVTEIDWSACASGDPVTLYRIEGGGHQIPGGRAFLPFLLGRSTREVSAAGVILKMFAEQDSKGTKL